MPQNLTHRIYDNVALAYKTWNSPTSTDPLFEGGLNVRTTAKGTSELRPGFATPLEPKPYTFTNCKRLYPWKTFASGNTQSSYIWMACDITAAGAQVLKFVSGVDNSFTPIFTSTSFEPFDFVDSNNTVFFANGKDAKQWEPVNGLTNWGIFAPVKAPTVTMVPDPNGISAYSGYYWGYTFADSLSGHESNMSPLSACSGIFTNEHAYLTPLVTPSRVNDRFDTINWYRTTDGGSTDPTEMAFVASTTVASPQLTDATLDGNLSATQFAPALLRNTPPPALKGLISYAGRIWGYTGNALRYSGQEEIANGVPQECFPSGGDGNFYKFESEINGIAPLADGVAPYLSARIWKVEGDTLDTFRRYKLLDRRGSKNRACIRALGSSVTWLDTALQIWLSDAGEIGKDIRPDLKTVTPSSACMEIHISGEYHWILLSNPATSKLYVYDLDTSTWMPPWAVNITAMGSGETSDGVVDLCVALNGTKVMKLTPGNCADDGKTYTSSAKMNLIDLAPKGQPDHVGALASVIVETNQYGAPSQVSVIVDDDPDFASYTPLQSPGTKPVLNTQGSYILQTEFVALTDAANKLGRRVGVQINWPAPSDPTQGWVWNTLDVAYQAVGVGQ